MADLARDRLFSVEGRAVVVTGGLGQLGRRFCRALRDRGARVAALDVAARDGATVARLSGVEPDPDLLVLDADVTDRDALESALRTIEDRWETPHALVNNAALDSPPDADDAATGPFEEVPLDALQETLFVNLSGAFQAAQVMGGAMARAGRGSIVNVSSVYAEVSPDQRLYAYRAEEGRPFVKPAAYTASKAGLAGLTRYLATYWAGSAVRVNTVTFGGVWNEQDRRFVDAYEARVPLGRMAREDEYDGALVFLISDASSYMTGANLVLDGGFTAW